MTENSPHFVMVPNTVLDSVLGLQNANGNNIGRNALAVYCAIRRHINKDRQAWPGQSAIAEAVGYKDTVSLKPLVNALVGAGVISVQHRWLDDDGNAIFRKTPNQTSNLYTFHDNPPPAVAGGGLGSPRVGDCDPLGVGDCDPLEVYPLEEDPMKQDIGSSGDERPNNLPALAQLIESGALPPNRAMLDDPDICADYEDWEEAAFRCLADHYDTDTEDNSTAVGILFTETYQPREAVRVAEYTIRKRLGITN